MCGDHADLQCEWLEKLKALIGEPDRYRFKTLDEKEIRHATVVEPCGWKDVSQS
jgi:hypothetical protein